MPRSRLREHLRQIIFEADTPAGKAFDVALIACIILSVVAVMLASVDSIRTHWGGQLVALEWAFTLLFTTEYLLRLWIVHSPGRYARSFFGMVDLLAIAPTYLSLLLPGAEYLIVIRSLRALRLFRVLKLLQFVDSGDVIRRALIASRHKIIVFIMSVAVLVIILGAIMYLVEGGQNGFDNIPIAVYWAIVTLTTVGYGDISPQTPTGQFLACLVMLLGYAIIAVPTGIVTVELSRIPHTSTRACPNCSAEGHLDDARYCRICGHPLPLLFSRPPSL